MPQTTITNDDYSTNDGGDCDDDDVEVDVTSFYTLDDGDCDDDDGGNCDDDDDDIEVDHTLPDALEFAWTNYGQAHRSSQPKAGQSFIPQ